MTTTEVIVQRLQILPEPARQEVLDFVEFLESRYHRTTLQEENIAWSRFSLASAMHDMEGEDTPYALADLSASFRVI